MPCDQFSKSFPSEERNRQLESMTLAQTRVAMTCYIVDAIFWMDNILRAVYGLKKKELGSSVFV